MIGIGKKKAPESAVDSLVDCHERIRRFSGIATRLAAAEGAPDAEVIEAATAVRRYFDEALPRHAADEDESVAPRLRGLDPEVDKELDRMTEEHHEHEAPLAALIGLCTEIAERPAALDERREELAAVAKTLADAFVPHLKREEDVIFPAMKRLLDREALDAISTEMAARRTK